jgi:hypothetical protein
VIDRPNFHSTKFKKREITPNQRYQKIGNKENSSNKLGGVRGAAPQKSIDP